MRKYEEITTKIKEKREEVFSFWIEVLISYLPFEYAKEFLKDTTEKEWEEKYFTPMDRETIIKEMYEYMEFAWGKVADHRGLSAGRSIDKMEAWIWLLEDDLVLAEIPYPYYGAPKLAAICKEYDFPIPTDDGVQNMIDGKPCTPNCQEGCAL